MSEITITKDVKISRFASGKVESGRVVLTDKALAPLVSDTKRYKCTIKIEDDAIGEALVSSGAITEGQRKKAQDLPEGI